MLVLNFFVTQKLSLLLLFLSLLIFINTDNIELESLLYPTTYTLLSHNIVIVASDGIRFFSSDMTEDTTKKISFDNQIQSADENEKTVIDQFSANNGGYIMILVKDILYFFQNDGTFINSVDLTSSINGKHYYLIPYKVEGDYLDYLISYPINNTCFGLIYCKFDLNFPNSNEIIKSQTIKPLLASEVRNYEYTLEK